MDRMFGLFCASPEAICSICSIWLCCYDTGGLCEVILVPNSAERPTLRGVGDVVGVVVAAWSCLLVELCFLLLTSSSLSPFLPSSLPLLFTFFYIFRVYMDDLLRTIRTQVLLSLLAPYTRVTLEFLASALNGIKEDVVESLLVVLLLDGRLKGKIDEVEGVLNLERGEESDAR